MTSDDELRKLSPVERSRLALEGLSIGDAFGQRFFVSPGVIESLLAARAFPASPWCWTDDTAMALSVHEVLAAHGKIDRDALAALFAARYRLDPLRGYGGMAHAILQAIGEGTHWSEAAGQAFGGQGSMGNGSAMRVAPVGGYFADDLEQVVIHAKASAEPTHAHRDAEAGAVAVAIAGAIAWQMGSGVRARSAAVLLQEVSARTPAGPTRDGVERAAALALDLDPRGAVDALGNGSQVICSDTVPFSAWCAARHLDDFEEALWTTVSGLGDRDTTCAIVGGIVSLCVGSAGIPEAFASAREPLDALPTGLEGIGRAG
jgi:ADP-ribosylglycohydrolase